MVEAFLLGGKIAFGAVGLAIGVRLLRVARSSEGVGIHMLASAVIFVGGVGLAAASVGSPECALINAAVAQMSTYYLLPSWVAGG